MPVPYYGDATATATPSVKLLPQSGDPIKSCSVRNLQKRMKYHHPLKGQFKLTCLLHALLILSHLETIIPKHIVHRLLLLHKRSLTGAQDLENVLCLLCCTQEKDQERQETGYVGPYNVTGWDADDWVSSERVLCSYNFQIIHDWHSIERKLQVLLEAEIA